MERGTLSIEMKWEPDGFFIRFNKLSDRTCFCLRHVNLDVVELAGTKVNPLTVAVYVTLDDAIGGRAWVADAGSSNSARAFIEKATEPSTTI
jgi:hypothetical protein